MSERESSLQRTRKGVVLLLTLLITVVFLGMIRGFLIGLFLAVVFSSLLHPLHERLVHYLRGRRSVAALLMLALIVLLIVLPLLGLLSVLATQAYSLSQEVAAWIQEHWRDAGTTRLQIPEWLPFREQIDLSGERAMAKIRDLAGQGGTLLLESISAATEGTATFLLHLFVMLYAMFFFLKQGERVQNSLMWYFPLATADKRRLFERAVSMVRATVKGTIVIGVIQGLLGGLAMTAVGVPGAAVWGTLMAVFSVVPGVGSALVWIPVVVYLFVSGQAAAAFGFLAWCSLVVASVDNVLRPHLVGEDTQLPDLLILVSTFGGLSVFGAVGLIVGPVIAGIFVTMWEVFGHTFEMEDEPVVREDVDS